MTVVMAVLAVIGLGNTVFTFVRNWKDAKKPHDEHVEMVKKHEEKLNNDWETIHQMQEENHLMLEVNLAVIEHIINGNHVDKLKEKRDKLQEYLINK